jgi:hypothetical protein
MFNIPESTSMPCPLCICPEDEGNMNPLSVGNYLPSVIAYHLYRLKYSAIIIYLNKSEI